MKDQSKTKQVQSESERRKVEQALKESEASGWSILESIQEGYYEVDLEGNFTFFNSSMSKILGYTEEEMMGMNYHRYVDKETSKKILHNFNEVYRTGISSKADYEQIKKDGSMAYVETSVGLKRDSFGKPNGFRGIVHDITDRKRAEEALQRVHVELEQRVADRTQELLLVNEELLKDITERKRVEEALQKNRGDLIAIIDNLPFLAWLKDSEGRFIAVNVAFARSCGFPSANDLVGKTDIDIWPKHLAEVYRADDLEVIRNRQQKSVEEPIAYKGVEKWFETYKAPLYDTNGNVTGTTGFARDITERKQAEEKLARLKQRNELILSSSAEGILGLDLQGDHVFVNPAAARMLGYEVEELIGRPSHSTWHHTKPDGSPYPKEECEIYAAYQEGAVHRTSTEVFWRKDGTSFPVEYASTPIYEQDRLAGAVLTFSDITERKNAEKQLQDTLESLRKAFGATIQVMVSAVEARDPYTSGHQLRSADLARAIATELGLPQEKIEGLRMAGSIHDIGKLSIPAEILSKPTKLSEIELALIKEHANRGYEMLKDVESPWPLAEIVHQHHERMDGSGYPKNLKGDEIMIEARILAVADTVEAMASHRPYRAGLGIEAALNDIEKNKGIFYDNIVADACLRLFREKGFQLDGT
jgi:PAS domain S-box-containing protein